MKQRDPLAIHLRRECILGYIERPRQLKVTGTSLWEMSKWRAEPPAEKL